MIIELICTPIFILLDFIISFLPVGITIPDWAISFIGLIQKALFFFPPDVLTTVVSVIVVSYSAQFIWAITEWVYKKIPGVK